jgi:hypothetical protein
MKQGKVFLVGECRGFKTEVVRYVDKKTGQTDAFTATNFLVERPGTLEVAIISQQVGRGEIDPTTVKVTAQKGKFYAFEVSGMEKVRGVLKVRMPAGIDPLPI